RRRLPCGRGSRERLLNGVAQDTLNLRVIADTVDSAHELLPTLGLNKTGVGEAPLPSTLLIIVLAATPAAPIEPPASSRRAASMVMSSTQLLADLEPTGLRLKLP